MFLLNDITDPNNNNPWITDPEQGGGPYNDFSNFVFDEPQADGNACFGVEVSPPTR